MANGQHRTNKMNQRTILTKKRMFFLLLESNLLPILKMLVLIVSDHLLEFDWNIFVQFGVRQWTIFLVMQKCSSGKRGYSSEVLAVEALIGAHTTFTYKKGQGPVSVYQCEDCHQFHFTSKGPMNDQLLKQLSDGHISKEREANHWISKFRRKWVSW